MTAETRKIDDIATGTAGRAAQRGQRFGAPARREEGTASTGAAPHPDPSPAGDRRVAPHAAGAGRHLPGRADAALDAGVAAGARNAGEVFAQGAFCPVPLELRVSLRLRPQTRACLEKLAEGQGVPTATLARDLLEQALAAALAGAPLPKVPKLSPSGPHCRVKHAARLDLRLRRHTGTCLARLAERRGSAMTAVARELLEAGLRHALLKAQGRDA